MFAAELDGRIVGIAGGYAPDEATAELISMWVAPSVRGRGAGDRLVGSVIAWAEDERHATLRLWVTDGNHRAERLYARHGFQRTGTVKPVHSGEDRMEFEMVRKLT